MATVWEWGYSDNMFEDFYSSLPGRSMGLFPNTPSSGYTYVNPYRSGDQAAQETLADLYEAEFQDYLNRFFPIEQDLIFQMTEGFGNLQAEEINRAQSAVARQFATAQGTETRRLASYGLSQDNRDLMSDFNRTQTSSLVAARNFARERSEQRRLEILSGGLGSSLRDRAVTGAA